MPIGSLPAVLAEAARYAAMPRLVGAPLVGAYSLPVNPLILAADPAVIERTSQ